MEAWNIFQYLLTLYHCLHLTMASQFDDVTTIYRFESLENVTSPECKKNEFLCGDGMCISKLSLCDGKRDCLDGTDEKCHSGRGCMANNFMCYDGSCIPDTQLCDGNRDCSNREDENDCWNGYSRERCPGQFWCSNRQCIDASLECNRVTDCSNGEDEDSCTPEDFVRGNMKEAYVEIHVRTTALGLPVAVSGGLVTKVSGTETDIPNWPANGTTSWTTENWKLSNNLLENSKFVYKPSWKTGETYDYESLTEPMNCRRGEQLGVIFIPAHSSDLLIIKMALSSHYYAKLSSRGGSLFRCYSNEFIIYQTSTFPGLPSGYVCEEDSLFTLPLPIGNEELAWKPSHAYKFRFSYNDNYLTLQIFHRSQWQTLVNIHEESSDKCAVQFGTDSSKGLFLNITHTDPYFELDAKEGRLLSYTFFPSAETVCVDVESSITPDTQSSLKLYLENLRNDDNLTVGVIDAHQEMEPNIIGFSRHRFLIDVPEEFQNDSLRVVLHAYKSDDAHVYVHQVSGCNAFDKEDVVLLSKRYVLSKALLPVYTVEERKFILPIPGTSKTSTSNDSLDPCDGRTRERCEEDFPHKHCLHGGSYDNLSHACRCPAGFVGELCEQGCGPNRYGDDCGGWCSGSVMGCKKMILCRPGVGCECAPGFTGDYCDSECAEDNYGSGCKQMCGHCKDSPCNPYTGVCHLGCQPGYYPPFCQTTYKYLANAPGVTSASYTWLTASISLHPENMRGEGEPRFFQLQYKALGEEEWREKEPQIIPEQSSRSEKYATLVNVTNLTKGTTYFVRVVLIDKNGESYQNGALASTVAKSLCTVTSRVDYHLRISNIDEHGFRINWNLTTDDPTMCPVTSFEVHVKEASRWIVHEIKGSEPHMLFLTDKIPGSTFHVRVRGVRDEGDLDFSQRKVVTTKMSKPGEVRNLQLVSAGSTNMHLQWEKPWTSNKNEEAYAVQYKCRQLLGCRHQSCSSSAGNLTVNATSVLLEDLVPHAQYVIAVMAVLSEVGSEMSILATTNQSEATIAPDASPQPVTERTNASFMFHWSKPKDCMKLNSYLHGYWYELRMCSEFLTPWSTEGHTEDEFVLFTGLTPSTEYEVKVFLITSAGRNREQFLVHQVTTNATVPGPVKHLTVYKSSRRLVSLRWSPPEQVYGPLESFRITQSCNTAGAELQKSIAINLAPCIAWPESYCHTINHLLPNTKYNFTVQALNSKVNEYGVPSTVGAITREIGAPWSPVGLRLVNCTDTTITVSWELPRMLNGVLRSFVISIEEEESQTSECCDYFPLEEMLVTAELKSYFKQLTGLKPSSKYRISVTGKTITMGPSANISTYTRPSMPALPQPPEVAAPILHGSAVHVTVHPAAHDDLLRGYLLLVVLRDQGTQITRAEIFNTDLELQLNSVVGSPYFIVDDIQQDVFQYNRQLQTMIGTGKQATEGLLARTEDPVLGIGEYRVGLAIVKEYGGVYSVGYVQSEPFTVM